jgi:hypothetical protein
VPSPSFACSVSCDTASLPVFHLPTGHTSNADNFDLFECIEEYGGGDRLSASRDYTTARKRIKLAVGHPFTAKRTSL